MVQVTTQELDQQDDTTQTKTTQITALDLHPAETMQITALDLHPALLKTQFKK
jgi:hypothetical protein